MDMFKLNLIERIFILIPPFMVISQNYYLSNSIKCQQQDLIPEEEEKRQDSPLVGELRKRILET